MNEIDPVSIMEFWSERSAVIEFEAQIPRINAESMALKEVVARYGQEAGRMVQRHRKEGVK